MHVSKNAKYSFNPFLIIVSALLHTTMNVYICFAWVVPAGFNPTSLNPTVLVPGISHSSLVFPPFSCNAWTLLI